MRRARGAVAIPAAVLVLAVDACNGSKGEDAGPTTLPPPPSTTTTTVVDVSTGPATIDIAYVQRVFDVLDQIRGEVVKEFLGKRQLTAEMGARLSVVYAPEELDRELQTRADQLKRDFSVFKDAPGIRRTLVQRLITARPDCIFVEAFFDNSQVLKNPPAPSQTYLVLGPRAVGSRAGATNPTPFSIASEDTAASDLCAAQS